MRNKHWSCLKWTRRDRIFYELNKTHSLCSITRKILYVIRDILQSCCCWTCWLILVLWATPPPARSEQCLLGVGCVTPRWGIRSQRILLWEYQHVLRIFKLLSVQCLSKYNNNKDRRSFLGTQVVCESFSTSVYRLLRTSVNSSFYPLPCLPISSIYFSVYLSSCLPEGSEAGQPLVSLHPLFLTFWRRNYIFKFSKSCI